MKIKIYTSIVLALVSLYSADCYAQANRTLSNLISPTAINKSLLPSADNKINLGSRVDAWKYVYLDSALFLGGNKFIYAPNPTSTFIGNTGNISDTGNIAVYNTFVGASAGKKFHLGSYNTGVGYDAMGQSNQGNDNTALGVYALHSNSGGSDNTASGNAALYNNTSGN